ncbi:MAG: ribonuclease III [Acidobacteriales bacterium]|nr:ribonuclease III [Terriglobales bacterium]
MASPPDLARLEEALGHHFQRRDLLERALTHSSHAHEGEAQFDNEQLEFLGDAVLGYVTSRYLFERFPEHSEGRLSKTKAHLVSTRHLAGVARELGFGDHLRLGRGEELSGGREKTALMVDALEATLAAMVLDAGMEPAQRFILSRIVEPELSRLEQHPDSSRALEDHKSLLQEWTQSHGYPQPDYRVIQEAGPDHKKHFTVELRVQNENGNNEIVERGEGPTKKRAEQQAAQHALDALKQRPGEIRTQE